MITARAIVQGLAGVWHGRYGVARCPAHSDHKPSLSVRDTRPWPALKCFAGCKHADIVGALQAMRLWPERSVDARPPQAIGQRARMNADPDEERRRTACAREIWDRAHPVLGTMAEAYLAGRAIRLPPEGTTALRYLPRLRHAPSGRGFPCLLAAVTDEHGRFTALQRTWIAEEGGGAKAPVTPARMTLGPMRRGAIRLFEPRARTMALAEGVETALSAYALYAVPVWAAAGAGRMAAVALPAHIERLVIFADVGPAGEREAVRAARAHHARGVAVQIIQPREEFGAAGDFNDAAQARAREKAARSVAAAEIAVTP